MMTVGRTLYVLFSAPQHIPLCLARYMLSSVRQSVAQTGGSYKNVELRIMKFSSYGSPIPLVYAGEVLSRNSKGFPERGVKRGGVGKISSFLSLSVNISKTVADTSKVIIND